MYVVISTIKMYNIAYEKLLNSIPKGVKIITVYQNEEKQFYEKCGQGYNVYLKKNIYEYGAWSGLLMLLNNNEISVDDWYLMIHDTCMFTPTSFDKIMYLQFILEHTPIELYFLLGGRFHNICMIRKNGITKVADYFDSIETLSKTRAIELEGNIGFEDIITGEYLIRPCHYPETDVYNEGRIRIPCFISSIDMFKFYSKDT